MRTRSRVGSVGHDAPSRLRISAPGPMRVSLRTAGLGPLALGASPGVDFAFGRMGGGVGTALPIPHELWPGEPSPGCPPSPSPRGRVCVWKIGFRIFEGLFLMIYFYFVLLCIRKPNDSKCKYLCSDRLDEYMIRFYFYGETSRHATVHSIPRGWSPSRIAGRQEGRDARRATRREASPEKAKDERAERAWATGPRPPLGRPPTD